MATKAASPSPQIVAREWRSIGEIDRGIARLKRRLTQIEQYKVLGAAPGAEQVLLSDYNATISDVFGDQSPEVRDHRRTSLWSGGIYAGMRPEQIAESKERVRQALEAILNSLVNRLEEKKLDLGAPPAANPSGAFAQLKVNDRIADVAEGLFEDGHYREAVFNAAKTLVNIVKEKSGRHDLDGKGLMNTVFSKNNPILAINDWADASDWDEQEGFMNLFAGVVLAIRNPAGHSFPELTRQRAIEYLSLINMLLERVRQAKKRSP